MLRLALVAEEAMMYGFSIYGVAKSKVVNRLALGLVAGLVSVGAVAAHAATVPDAQVESNVLKALAGASDLANQQIQTTTVYGVVTLSGSVQTEAQRTEAENLAARAVGVQKVVDELTLGAAASVSQPAPPQADPQGGNQVLLSDGTMGPAPAPDAQQAQQQSPAPIAQGNPGTDNTGNPNQPTPNYGPGAPEYHQQTYPGGYGPPPAPNGNPASAAPGYPTQGNGYPPQGNTYPTQSNGYPVQGNAMPPRGYAPPPSQQYGAQVGGQNVTVPSGALVRIRINQALNSSRNKVGDQFDGIVVNDVIAGGEVAIPRGASVHGTVTAATKSGALAGRGELSLQLTQVTLAGKTFPVVSDVWSLNGADKTTRSVNSTVVGGGIGALIGAAAGGGTGAAIGAGVGGALGLGSSAASPAGQVFVPAEGMLTFHLAQEAPITTVSQAEMDRLATGVPAGGQQGLQRRSPYGPYYGPAYYRPAPYPY
jgi:hypothetical protein